MVEGWGDGDGDGVTPSMWIHCPHENARAAFSCGWRIHVHFQTLRSAETMQHCRACPCGQALKIDKPVI